MVLQSFENVWYFYGISENNNNKKTTQEFQELTMIYSNIYVMRTKGKPSKDYENYQLKGR